jgi:hypothetical protein
VERDLRDERIAELERQLGALQEQFAALQEQNHRLREDNQGLRDEVARLKGQKAKPKIAPSRLNEKERKKRRGRRKGKGGRELEADRTVVIEAEQVPKGSRFKGYDDYWVQELVIHAGAPSRANQPRWSRHTTPRVARVRAATRRETKGRLGAGAGRAHMTYVPSAPGQSAPRRVQPRPRHGCAPWGGTPLVPLAASEAALVGRCLSSPARTCVAARAARHDAGTGDGLLVGCRAAA